MPFLLFFTHAQGRRERKGLVSGREKWRGPWSVGAVALQWLAGVKSWPVSEREQLNVNH